MKSKEFLQEIRRADGLERAILKDIIVEGNSALFRLITDKSYTGEDVKYASSVAQKYVPAGFTGAASVMKSVPDGAAVARFIKEYLTQKYPVASAFIEEKDLRIEAGVGGGNFILSIGKDEAARLAGEKLIDELSKELALRFCGAWCGEIALVERTQFVPEQQEDPVEYTLASRYFPIADYIAVDGAGCENAIYIVDLTQEAENVTVCGSVKYIEEHQGKNDKPYFTLSIEDATGQMRATYFAKKATIEKVRKIKSGDSICLTGDNQIFKSSLSFTSRKLDFGRPPKDFVPEARPSLPVPARYKRVVPVEISDYEQSDMFGKEALPTELTERDFVVFDLETTGLNNNAVAGMMDRIIEVGAVRIHEGKIVEKFASFVACPVRISEEITKLTGIDASMLKGAPEVGDVMADFYKFCDGATLVAHNAPFDIKFVRHYAGAEGYYFEAPPLDTVDFAQRVVRLSNYKLNTIADHFGFKFNHHRAFDDAFVTAKIFIELARLNKGLY